METLISKINALLTKLYPSFLKGKLPVDKFMHILCGFVFALVLTPFIDWYSVIVVSLIATAKELYDALHKDIHTPDVWDLLVTIAGGVLGYVFISPLL